MLNGPAVAVAAACARLAPTCLLVAEQAGLLRALLRFAVHAFRKPRRMLDAATLRAAFLGVPYHTDAWVTRAEGTGHLEAVVLQVGGREVRVACDWLGCAAGLTPVTDVAQLLGCEATTAGITVDDEQATTVGGVWAAGECTGVKGDQPSEVEGEIAGRAAAQDRQGARDARLQRGRSDGRRFGELLSRSFAPRAELLALARPDTILCRCEDVAIGAVDPRWTQRQAKLWTRVGMGACQGAVCGPACSALFGWETNAVRPPLGAPCCADWADALHR